MELPSSIVKFINIVSVEMSENFRRILIASAVQGQYLIVKLLFIACSTSLGLKMGL